MFRFLSNPVGRGADRAGLSARRRTVNDFRPQLQGLEDRTAPAVLTVNSLADHGAGTLRDAVAMAAPGDTITFDSSLSGGTINLSTGQININSDLLISSLGSTQLTINALNRSRIFNIGSGTNVAISGLTLTNGYARVTATDPGFGGAIEEAGTLVVNDVAFLNDTSPTGGGAIDAFGSNTDTLTVTNSSFKANKTLSGFGAGISDTDPLTVVNTLFEGNYAPGGGAAIDFFVSASSTATNFSLSVTGSSFLGNIGANGGAIYANDSPGQGTLTISVDSSRFLDNEATGAITVTGDSGFGGAIDTFFRLSGSATSAVSITNSTFADNQGNYGAGIDDTLRTADSSSGTYMLQNVTSTGNEGTRGGGFYNEVLNSGTGSITIGVDSSTFDNNGTSSVTVTSMGSTRTVSGDGAGAFNTLAAVSSGPVMVSYTNDTIADNSAETSAADNSGTAKGGGLYFENTGISPLNVSLDSLTVAYNDAATAGGGLFAVSGMTVQNTIIGDNTVEPGGLGPDVSGGVSSLGYNLVSNTTGSSGWGGNDILNVDPGLATLGNYGGPTQTIALLPGSPAIGAGFTNLPTDQMGNMRNVPTDIGAVEFVLGGTSQPTDPTVAALADLGSSFSHQNDGWLL